MPNKYPNSSLWHNYYLIIIKKRITSTGKIIKKHFFDIKCFYCQVDHFCQFHNANFTMCSQDLFEQCVRKICLSTPPISQCARKVCLTAVLSKMLRATLKYNNWQTNQTQIAHSCFPKCCAFLVFWFSRDLIKNHFIKENKRNFEKNNIRHYSTDSEAGCERILTISQIIFVQTN